MQADHGRQMNHCVRSIAQPSGLVSTLAGGGVAGFADGVGAGARFNQPWGIALDAAAASTTTTTPTAYVGDWLNNRVRTGANWQCPQTQALSTWQTYLLSP